MVKVRRSRKIAEQVLGFEDGRETYFFFYHCTALLFYALPRPFIAQVNLIAGCRMAQQHAHLFEQLAKHGDPVSKRNAEVVMIAKNSARLLAGYPAASVKNLLGIIRIMDRAAGKNIEAAEKPHLLGAPRQENFKIPLISGSGQNHRGSVAGANHNN